MAYRHTTCSATSGESVDAVTNLHVVTLSGQGCSN